MCKYIENECTLNTICMSKFHRRKGGTKEKLEATKKYGKFKIMKHQIPIQLYEANWRIEEEEDFMGLDQCWHEEANPTMEKYELSPSCRGRPLVRRPQQESRGCQTKPKMNKIEAQIVAMDFNSRSKVSTVQPQQKLKKNFRK